MGNDKKRTFLRPRHSFAMMVSNFVGLFLLL